MSNSALASYTKLSPNKNSPRNHTIDTITIHCTAGSKNNTAKQIADQFSTVDRGASCNYAVGGDGSIALVVDEKDRSWCTSSGEKRPPVRYYRSRQQRTRKLKSAIRPIPRCWILSRIFASATGSRSLLVYQ